MIGPLVLHTLRARRLAMFWFSVAMFAYALLVVAVWPAAGAMDFAAYIKEFPEPLQAMLLGSGRITQRCSSRARACHAGRWIS